MKGVIGFSIFLVSLLSGCVGVGPDGKRVVVVNLAPSPCIGVEQYADKIGAKATYEQLVSAEGTVEPQELVDYQETFALLQNQSKQACDLFNRGRIDWNQYQSEMQEVRAALKEIAVGMGVGE